MSQNPQARRRSKRLAAYDEADGDFSFTRVSKKAKTAPTEPEPKNAPAVVAPKKSRSSLQRDHDVSSEAKKPLRRDMSFSTPILEKDEGRAAKRGARKSTRLSAGKTSNQETTVNGIGVETEYDSIDMIGVPAPDETNKSIVEVSNQQSTMIALPFSDTPVINRNKELRKKGAGARRSSLGMRGRRASSLIDSGHRALPHAEVETHDFYKHIESDGLIEPRRMKQLLMWTGARVMASKPAHGDPEADAKHAARTITDQLLQEFATKSEFSNWFSREESALPPTKIIKLPNPRNVQNSEKIVEMEANIKKLKEDRDQWKSFSKPPAALPPLFQTSSEPLSASDIDSSLLEQEQAAILSNLGTSSNDMRTYAVDRLSNMLSGLEFKVDQFADGIHKVEEYQNTANRVADKILALSAVRLEERDRKEKAVVGTRDVPMQEVLRSLSRILPEGNTGR